jgi:hypothetical protein
LLKKAEKRVLLANWRPQFVALHNTYFSEALDSGRTKMPEKTKDKLSAIRRLVITLLACLLVPATAYADAPPKGPYQESCRNARILTDTDPPYLVAECQNSYGQFQIASLAAPDSCPSAGFSLGPVYEIYNVNGALRCSFKLPKQDSSGHGNVDRIGKTTWTDSARAIQYTYWTVDQPNIAAPFTLYPDITYEAGDSLVLDAGGCAQSGGKGKTWKRYVNPSGPDSGPPNGKYFGVAVLPDTSASNSGSAPPSIQSTISSESKQALTVFPNPKDPPNKALFLTLGYVDDGYPNSLSGYGDNGYYAHDDGDNNQCSSTVPASYLDGPAWVSLEVIHPLKPTSPASLPYTAGLEPFDVVFNEIDANGLPLNPKWQSQLTGGLSYAPEFSRICGPAFSTPSTYSAANVLGDIGSVGASAAAGAAEGSTFGPVGAVLMKRRTGRVPAGKKETALLVPCRASTPGLVLSNSYANSLTLSNPIL